MRGFHTKPRQGDAARALAVMAPDIEWLTTSGFEVEGRNRERVPEGAFKPLMEERASFAPELSAFIADGATVVPPARQARAWEPRTLETPTVRVMHKTMAMTALQLARRSMLRFPQ